MSISAARFLVAGRVQGVFFRASTAREAARLGLHGYAHNLADGRVEVLAVGVVEAIRELEEWLNVGPPSARVDEVQRFDEEPEAHLHRRDFRTG